MTLQEMGVVFGNPVRQEKMTLYPFTFQGCSMSVGLSHTERGTPEEDSVKLCKQVSTRCFAYLERTCKDRPESMELMVKIAKEEVDRRMRDIIKKLQPEVVREEARDGQDAKLS